MNSVEYRETRKKEITSSCTHHFAIKVKVREVLFDDITLSPHATMSVFSCHNRKVFALIESTSTLRLGDIERLTKNAGFSPRRYAAPHGHKSYFLQRAYNIFRSVYPGRTQWTHDEESYYSLLVPYSPALVEIDGLHTTIRRFNTFSNSWQVIYEVPQRLRRMKV